MKDVLKTAERALSAAVACTSAILGNPPKMPSERLFTLRNKAVHQGAYPTLSDAEEHCRAVEAFVRETEQELNRIGCINPATYWIEVFREDARPFYDKAQAEHVTVLVQGDIGLLLSTAKPPPTFDGRLAAYKEGVIRIV